MKANMITFGILLVACCSLASSQQAPHGSNTLTIPCPSNYLYVPARTLLENRTQFAMPEYPPTAIEAKIEGEIALIVLIDKQGNVTDASARKGDPVLISAAAKAISQWKFKPFTLEQDQKGVESLVVLTFGLNGHPSVTDAGPPELVDLLDTTLRIKPLCFPPAFIERGLIRRVDPEYPREARLAHIAGDVVIDVIIDKSGNVVHAKVLQGHPLLIKAALTAVTQWKYSPFEHHNEPVEAESTVTVRFHM